MNICEQIIAGLISYETGCSVVVEVHDWSTHAFIRLIGEPKNLIPATTYLESTKIASNKGFEETDSTTSSMLKVLQ